MDKADLLTTSLWRINYPYGISRFICTQHAWRRVSQSRYQAQGQVTTLHSICGMWLLVSALGACFWCTSPHATLQWHHNGCHGDPNHRWFRFLSSRVFRRTSNEAQNLRVTGPLWGASNAEKASIWWHYHDEIQYLLTVPTRPVSLVSWYPFKYIQFLYLNHQNLTSKVLPLTVASFASRIIKEQDEFYRKYMQTGGLEMGTVPYS